MSAAMLLSDGLSCWLLVVLATAWTELIVIGFSDSILDFDLELVFGDSAFDGFDYYAF